MEEHADGQSDNLPQKTMLPAMAVKKEVCPHWTELRHGNKQPQRQCCISNVVLLIKGYTRGYDAEIIIIRIIQ